MSDPLSFLSLRLLQALQAAGEDGLSLEEVEALDIPQVGWRLNELRTAGFVVSEAHDRLFLVHDPGAASTGAPDGNATARTPRAGGPEEASGVPVDVAPRLFDLSLLVAA